VCCIKVIRDTEAEEKEEELRIINGINSEKKENN